MCQGEIRHSVDFPHSSLYEKWEVDTYQREKVNSLGLIFPEKTLLISLNWLYSNAKI
jgi:hypothetical protein